MESYFAEDESFQGVNFLSIIHLWNGSNGRDERLFNSDFERGVKPY